MTEAKAIRNSVEGRDTPRGPTATDLHARALRAVAGELAPPRDAYSIVRARWIVADALAEQDGAA